MKLLALAAALTLVAGAAQAQTSAQKADSPSNNDTSRLGGYAPAAPLFSTGTTPPPGTQVVFVPSTQTPSEAFPPPAPKESYPICKRGQFDGCRQRGS